MKPIEERIEDFRKTLEPFELKYGLSMIEEFFDKWTEKNRSGTKFKAEKEETWEVHKRLATWKKNSDKWNKPKTNGQTSKKHEQLNDLERIAKTILGRGDEGSLFN